MENYDKDSEKRILDLFREDVDGGMDALFAEYADRLCGVAGRYIPDQQTLKDVMQEAFIKIFTQIGSFSYRGEGSLQAWMRRIVVNEALMELRREKSESLAPLAMEPPDEIEEDVSPEGLTADALEQMIVELPPRYRAVFNLFAVEGLTHREIGRMLGISPSTSASQYHRARASLKKKIKDYKQNNRL